MLPVARLSAALADRYRLARELGAGGMATVYLAQDLKHDRKVAIKVLDSELAATVGADRFLSEITIAARLQHPCILTVLDSGEADGQLWYAMPFVDGESLRAKIARDGELPIATAVEITREVADALDHAHRQGVVHRDMACVTFEMLTGEAPYTGATARAIMTKRVTDPVPSPRGWRTAISLALDLEVMRALSPVPADRHATAGEFAGAVAQTAQITAPLGRRLRQTHVVIGAGAMTGHRRPGLHHVATAELAGRNRERKPEPTRQHVTGAPYSAGRPQGRWHRGTKDPD